MKKKGYYQKKKPTLVRAMLIGLSLSMVTPCMNAHFVYGQRNTQNTEVETVTHAVYEQDASKEDSSFDMPTKITTVTKSLTVTEDVYGKMDGSFHDLLDEYDPYLSNEVSESLDVMNDRIQENQVLSALIKWKFTRTLGADFLESFRKKSQSHEAFISCIMQDPSILDTFLQGRVDLKQDRLRKALEIWQKIWNTDEDAHDGFYSKLAIATGYAHSETQRVYGYYNPVIDPVKRYKFIKKLYKDDMFFDHFDTYNVTYLSMITGNRGSEEDIYWVHDFVDTKKSHYKEQDKIKSVAFSIPYGRQAGEKGYGEPWTLKDTIVRGGVCARISQFGTIVCNSFGVPSSLINQPGHRAFLHLHSDNTWHIGNNIGGFGVASSMGRTIVPWGKHPAYILLIEDAFKDEEDLKQSQQLLWLTEFTHSPLDRLSLINQAIGVQPLNYFAWKEKIDCLLEKDTSIKEWIQLKTDVIDTFTQHPKVMMDLLELFEDHIFKNDRVVMQQYILDVYDALEKVRDPRQDSVVKIIKRDFAKKDFYLATFSFSGNYAGRLMGIETDVEYSLDGGIRYKPATEKDMKLSDEEIQSITHEKDILLRIKGTREPIVFPIEKYELKSKKIQSNDKLNTLSGLDSSMEFSIDGKKTWIRYTGDNLPDLSGNVIVHVRIAAKNNYLASNIITKRFISTNFSFDGEHAGRLMGLDKNEQYSLDGGKTYHTATEDNMQLSNEQIKSITAQHGILLKFKDEDQPILISLLTSNLRDKDINSSDYSNTLTGLNSSMEFSIDGKKTWTKYTRNNLPDLSGTVTIYIRKAAKGLYLPSNIITRKFTPATFSFNGEHTGRLMGITTDMEYSLDGGLTYKTAIQKDMKLSNEEVASITTKGIRLRTKGTNDTFLIPIKTQKLWWSTINGNDANNTLRGLRGGMEFSIDNKKTWTKYTGNNLPDLSGYITVHVRKSATRNYLPSNIITRKFTPATFSFSGSNKGKLVGITTNTEYSLDGGITYKAATEKDMKLSDQEISSVTKEHGILLRTKGMTDTFLITITKSSLSSNALKANDVTNTLSGLKTNMEFSIDNKKTWTKYTGNNLPDLSKDVTIHVRIAAKDTILPSNVITKKFIAARFLFDGEHAEKLMGVAQNEQYSLDGGKTYYTATKDNMQLPSEQIQSITAQHGILVKLKSVEQPILLPIRSCSLRDRDIKNSDYSNTLTGLNSSMEFSIDGKKTWTKYIGNNLPDLTGTVTIYIRKAATSNILPSNIITRKFTPATFSFSGENARKLMGITTDMEYSLDGGLTYKIATQKDMKLSNEEVASITTKGIRLRSKGTDDTFLIPIKTQKLWWTTIKGNDTSNTLSGLRGGMEFSIDNKKTWTKYTGNNLPNVSGDVTVHVRKYATRTYLPSNIITRTFTK